MPSISSDSEDDLLAIYTQLMLDSIDVPDRSAVEPARPMLVDSNVNPKPAEMNAKKRKLEKKKIKREESKRTKADLVEEAGELDGSDYQTHRSPAQTLSRRVPAVLEAAYPGHLALTSKGGYDDGPVSLRFPQDHYVDF
jgi:hypothetical protein